MTQEEKNIVNELVVSGVIGASLGALITNNKTGAGIGAMAGVAIMASLQALKKAEESDIPIIFEEDGYLIELKKDGTKEKLKPLPPKVKLKKKRIILS